MPMNCDKLRSFVCVIPLSFSEIQTHFECTTREGSLFLRIAVLGCHH